MITYPVKKSEFEIQAEVYNYLKNQNIDVRGEVNMRDINGKKGFKQFRFDLVVFQEKKAVLIIEVKSPGHRVERFCNTRQFKKYSALNVGLLVINTFGDKEKLQIHNFLQTHNESKPISICKRQQN